MASVVFDMGELEGLARKVAHEVLGAMEARQPRDEAGRILWTKQETAEALGVSEATVDRLRAKGLPAVKLDGRVMFRPQAVEAWAEKMEG